MSIRSFFEFGYKYVPAAVASRFLRPAEAKIDICFATSEDSRGWILDRICSELASRSRLRTRMVYGKRFSSLPPARAYFFPHAKFLAKALHYSPRVWNAVTICDFTHENWERTYSREHILFALRKATRVICLNSGARRWFMENGFPASRLELWHLGADPDRFPPHERGSGSVGFCSSYYPRKNPVLLHRIVERIQPIPCILVGRRWEEYPGWEELRACPNFTYYDIPYDGYPEMYAKMDVFVSTSSKEGGPVPLLEAMLSNVVPVVSTVGWGPDLITHGVNGYLFEPDATAEEVVVLIRAAFENRRDVRPSALPHSWASYAEKLDDLVARESGL